MWGNNWNNWGPHGSENNQWNSPSKRQINIEEAPWNQEGGEFIDMDTWGEWEGGGERQGYYNTTKGQEHEYQQEDKYAGGYQGQVKQQIQYLNVGKMGGANNIRVGMDNHNRVICKEYRKGKDTWKT